MATLQRRLSVRPSDVAGTSQMKHPMMSWWNVAKTSQWCVSTTSYWYVITTSQKVVTTTPHYYVSTTSQASLKWNTQPRLSHDVPLARLYNVSCKSQIKQPKNVVVVCLHHVSELPFRDVLLVGLYYIFKLLCLNLHLVGS